jgi:hypothetical protein
MRLPSIYTAPVSVRMVLLLLPALLAWAGLAAVLRG